MTPEVIVLIVNAAGLALAYGAVYPRLLPMTYAKMMAADTVITVVLVGISALWFRGEDTQFWLFGWYVGPVIFALITLLIIEMPLFSWFTKKHDIRF
ncbi:MAG: hypothetical protein U5N55_02525 [Cypionkella sp.]|nr:hypothetical protein [Cypionkella sp.]